MTSGYVLDQRQPKNEEEYQECITTVVQMKNAMVNRSGVSPEMAVFGRVRRLPGDLLSETKGTPLHPTVHLKSTLRTIPVPPASIIKRKRAQDLYAPPQ